MNVSCILQGQNNSGIKLENQKFIQDFEDVTQEVKSAVGVDVLEENVTTLGKNIETQGTDISTLDKKIENHIQDEDNPHKVTAEQIGAVISSGMVYGEIENNITQDKTDITNKIKELLGSDGMKYVTILPEIPSSPIAEDEEIPYSWKEINAIALSGHAEDWISVGAIKSVTLTEVVLGTTTHDVRVIGINQDNYQSITFQTKNCLKDTITFDKSSWTNSTARVQCQNYYNAFPYKDMIVTVSKGNCVIGSSQRDSLSVLYNDDNVWIPSEMEMGLNYVSSLDNELQSVFKAECTKGKKFQYSYYTSNANRIKKQGDSGSTCYYWERSLYCNYNSSSDQTWCGIAGSGEATILGINLSFGLAPAFVIGNNGSDAIIQNNKIISNQLRTLLTDKSVKCSTGTYVGTGGFKKENYNTLIFDFKPEIVIISDDNGSNVGSGYNTKILILIRDNLETWYWAMSSQFNYPKIFSSWGDREVNWYHDGTIYYISSYGGLGSTSIVSGSAYYQFNSVSTYRYIAFGRETNDNS